MSINFQFRVMEKSDISQVCEIESASHLHPWSEKNFMDCLEHQYWNYVLLEESSHSQKVGYCIVMPGVEELHLLNITIHPQFRRQNIASRALSAIEEIGLTHHYIKMLLEVRRSNTSAIRMYEKLGYQLIGVRKDYYPMAKGDNFSREDALVMEKFLRKSDE
ncbi:MULTISPECIES: ribosomal protein S18-alanine N-acetyltransferase [unclassified Polynucleobacter]|uniref:ribosomal protein S18-alanine N-acetyltransferase n=1 Tax=unclassified Polynucleobacter TaxID=2640945 RepID=UPI002492104C|nr:MULTISPECIES: ribosomal protein S18-alanine N-acetyltransferase [unclassified Polynucleobacter]